MRRAAIFLATVMLPYSATACREPSTCTGCGVAVIVMGADADALLPPFVRSGPGLAVSDLMYLKLADIGLDLNTVGDAGFQPRLAQSWKFEDSLTIAFSLDPRARWHDGQPVTAADVAFTFDVYRDSIVNANARPLLQAITSVTPRDDHTVVFQFTRPYSEQFYDATYHMRIVPKHLLDTIPRAGLESHEAARNPVGDGPYRFVSWRAKETVELAADSAFFLGRPGISRVVFRVLPDVNAAITQIVANQADAIEYAGGPDEVARINATKQFRIVNRPAAAYIYLGFNLYDPAAPRKPHPIFGDREVRRALAQALDRKTMAQALLGDFGKIPVGPTSRLTPLGNDSTIPQLDFDTAQARATLAKEGWKDSDGDGILDRNGRKLEFEILVPSSSPNRVRAATIIVDELRRLGVSARANALEFNLFLDQTNRHHFDAALNNWGDDPSPSGIRQMWVSSSGATGNVGRYYSAEFNRLVNEAINARDTATAHARWKAAYAVINADAPAVWLYTPLEPTAIHHRYENVTVPRDVWTSSLWTWRVPSDMMIDRDHFAGRAP